MSGWRSTSSTAAAASAARARRPPSPNRAKHSADRHAYFHAVRTLLRDALPLRRSEWGLALFLYFLLMVMVGADWVGKLGADALFVKRYGVQNVPFMYIITPIAMLAVSALIFFFIDLIRRRTILLVFLLAVTLASEGIQYAIT